MKQLGHGVLVSLAEPRFPSLASLLGALSQLFFPTQDYKWLDKDGLHVCH